MAQACMCWYGDGLGLPLRGHLQQHGPHAGCCGEHQGSGQQQMPARVGHAGQHTLPKQPIVQDLRQRGRGVGRGQKEGGAQAWGQGGIM